MQRTQTTEVTSDQAQSQVVKSLRIDAGTTTEGEHYTRCHWRLTLLPVSGPVPVRIYADMCAADVEVLIVVLGLAKFGKCSS